MPRAALSSLEIAAFRERIRDAAARLFVRAGYEAVTMRAIAAEVGCSAMTPYRYFRTKDEIFAAVRSEAFRRFADVQERALRRGEEALAGLRALGRAYVEFARSDPDSYRLMFELGQAPASRHPELAAQSARAWSVIHGAVSRAIVAGELEGDADVVARVFWAGVHGIASLALAGILELGVSLERLVEPMLETLIEGNRRKEVRRQAGGGE